MATLMDHAKQDSRASDTATITINAAFMQEIKEASDELWQLLRMVRHLCDQPISIRMHAKRTVDMLEQVVDQLALSFSLEGYYGYFEDPADVDPRLSERATKLRDEHEMMYLDMCGIVDRAERLLDQHRWASLTRHVALRFPAFYEQLKAHEAREEALMWEAFGDDIGVGD